MKEYLMYLRKSRQDNANETVEQVLQRHYDILYDLALKVVGEPIPESNIYREIVSGETIDDRPQIQAIFRRLERGNVAGVLVVEPQRLTRGDLLDCGTVVHLFRYTNTKIITPTKTYDLSDKYDRRFFEMELSRGNDYLEYTKEVLARGRKQSAKEGNYLGSVAPYGYKRVKLDKSWTLEPDENEAPYIPMIFEAYIAGDGGFNIASKIESLGAKPRHGDHFTQAYIYQIVDNPVYTGKIAIGKRGQEMVIRDGKLVKRRFRKKTFDVIDGKHPALISEETFNVAKQMRGTRTKERTHTELVNPFAHVLKCKKCGSAVQLINHKHEPQRYTCTKQTHCHNISCTRDKLDKAIYDALLGYLSDFEIKLEQNNDDVVKSHQSVIKALKTQLAKLEERQASLYDFLETKVYSVSVFNDRNAKLAEERKTILEKLEKAEKSAPDVQALKEKSTTLHYALNALKDDKIPAKAKNNLIQAIVDKIYYLRDDEGIQIEIILK